MARRTKSAPTPNKKGTTGRVTPKGGPKAPVRAPVTSGRYTPPVPKAYKSSPPWVLVLLLAFLIGGMLVILCNYLGCCPAGPRIRTCSSGWA